MIEEWRTVHAFPDYEISNAGVVRKKDTHEPLKYIYNQGGKAPKVVLRGRINTKPAVRGVRRLHEQVFPELPRLRW